MPGRSIAGHRPWPSRTRALPFAFRRPGPVRTRRTSPTQAWGDYVRMRSFSRSSPGSLSMKNYVRILAGPLLVLTVVAGALWLLHYELREYELQDFLDSLARIPASVLWSAVGLTCLNYVILIGYDLLGVTYLGQKMHWAKVAFGSFLGCAVGNNLGNLLGGSTVRYRLYSAWGLTAVDIVRMVLILSVTFWIGLFAISGVMFIWRPVGIPLVPCTCPSRPRVRWTSLLLGLAVGYLRAVLAGAQRRETGEMGVFATPARTLAAAISCRDDGFDGGCGRAVRAVAFVGRSRLFFVPDDLLAGVDCHADHAGPWRNWRLGIADRRALKPHGSSRCDGGAAGLPRDLLSVSVGDRFVHAGSARSWPCIRITRAVRFPCWGDGPPSSHRAC